ncbi:venom metalloproteinase 3-like [Venturia canescens]|uniref:venom metalloproteinase 3-like n=1 Tax=Venturia canescens TaxID=32260 RepID=UPI001C9CC5C8|nr:venom metalloproteinase 3-like [Venturia canescens]
MMKTGFTAITSKGLVSLSFLTVILATRNADLEDVHLRMNEDELKHTFSPLASTSIPEYEVVSLEWPRLHRRASSAGTRIRMNAFGKDIELWLHPTEGTLAAYDTPVILAESSTSTKTGVRFTKIPDGAMSVVGRILEDREKRATLLVKRSIDGHNYISGNVGSEGWIVRPLPDRFNDENVAAPNNFSSDPRIEEYDAPRLHVIYASPESTREGAYLEKPIGSENTGKISSRLKRTAATPDLVYPQILVFADYATYRLHGENVSRLLEYLLPFWNGVDLRYRSLEFPKVRLNIAGIVIATDSTALSFIKNNKVSEKVLNIFGAVSDFSKFMPNVQSSFPFSKYDVAITLSPFAMCSPQTSGSCPIGTLGIAYRAGACSIVKRGTPMNLGVAVVQDKGAFDGMHTAAHELGHLFGADHDGLGGSSCPSDTGNIMASTPILTRNSQDWSKCSLIAFDKFFNSDAASCMFNVPVPSTSVKRILPGELMTLDEQCAKLEGTKMCQQISPNVNPCINLRCVWSRNRNYCIEMSNAGADGSICGDKKICVHGRCLSESELLAR